MGFENLKHKTEKQSIFKDMSGPMSGDGYCKSPGATTSVTKWNESRLTRCKVCGFICDRERDVRLKDGTFAGRGIAYSSDKATVEKYGPKTPAATSVAGGTGSYVSRTVHGGCPSCGSFLYDQIPTQIP